MLQPLLDDSSKFLRWSLFLWSSFLFFSCLFFSFNKNKSVFFAECPRGPIRTLRSALIRQLFLSHQPHSINLHSCPSFYRLPCAHSLAVPLFICLSSDGRQCVCFWTASHWLRNLLENKEKIYEKEKNCKDLRKVKPFFQVFEVEGCF